MKWEIVIGILIELFLELFLELSLELFLELEESEMKQRSNSGQAVVEYILILVVSVTLILSLASVIFTPFQIFLNQFLGEYVSCLLESGELPPMGTDSLKAKTSCPIPKFKGGAPVSIPGGPTGSGYSSSSSSNGSNGSSSGSSDSDKNGSNSDGSNSDDSSKNRQGTRGNLNSGGSGGMGSRPTASDGAGGNSSKSRELEIPDQAGSGGPGTFSGNRFANTALGLSGKKTRAIGLDGMTDEQKSKLKPSERGGQTKISAGDGMIVKEKKTTIKPPERKVAGVAEEEDSGFQFGNLIRILFIIGIIVIIIALIGGQVAQMVKSWES